DDPVSRGASRSVSPPTRPLRLDDDHAVGAAHSVDRRIADVLQDLDRFDVVRIDPGQAAVRTGLHRDAVDYIQRLGTRVEGRGATDAHGDSAFSRLADFVAVETSLQLL